MSDLLGRTRREFGKQERAGKRLGKDVVSVFVPFVPHADLWCMNQPQRLPFCARCQSVITWRRPEEGA